MHGELLLDGLGQMVRKSVMPLPYCGPSAGYPSQFRGIPKHRSTVWGGASGPYPAFEAASKHDTSPARAFVARCRLWSHSRLRRLTPGPGTYYQSAEKESEIKEINNVYQGISRP